MKKLKPRRWSVYHFRDGKWHHDSDWIIWSEAERRVQQINRHDSSSMPRAQPIGEPPKVNPHTGNNLAIGRVRVRSHVRGRSLVREHTRMS